MICQSCLTAVSGQWEPGDQCIQTNQFKMPSVVPRICKQLLLTVLAVNTFIQCCFEVGCRAERESENVDLRATVMVVILARNKAHTLPYFLGYLETLSYPKDRISLWIRSDHNVDNTADVLTTWLDAHKKEYHSVDVKIDDDKAYFSDEKGLFDWSPMHFHHVITIKEEALQIARHKWADFVWFVDCDVFITNSSTLGFLVDERKTIIAPLIESLGAYSNYWCGVTEQGYYKRTEDYLPILEREKVGCFDVPMVHSAVLIDLRKRSASNLHFDPEKIDGYTGAKDDIIAFAYSAKSEGVKMHILNTHQFGFMLAPLEKGYTLYDDKDQLVNLKVEMLVDGPPMYVSPVLQHFVPSPEPSSLGLDEIYLINLKRRPERKVRMFQSLKEMGLRATLFTAVDGLLLNDTSLHNMGIKMLPEYADPYHKRPITKGEIGCFLSHYTLWKDMISKQHRTALIFEDDLRFEPYFKKKVESLLKEAQKIGLLWDLIYLGRKRLSENSEPYVQGTTSFVHVDYSYWTLCYLLTLEGAKKLVGANPLPKIVPVDEYLPIMFDRHPEVTWKGYYPKRNLRAYSAHPLLVYPQHYTGEPNYVSDTEDSETILLKDEL